MESLFNKKNGFWLVVIAIVPSLPFLNKPYHIDDPFVLHVSQIVLEHPLDPFHGEFDWFGFKAPVWELTTNPPLLSYYLAPFAWISDYSEIVLHLAMLVFMVMLAGALFWLAQRFCRSVWLPLLFVMLSPAVVISSNVMRDVPAAALGTLAVALYVYGTDKENWRWLLAGGTLAGLAVLTKYSSIIFLPVLALYPFLKGKFRLMIWVWPILAILGLWCLHNQIMYGKIHILYLLLERELQAGAPKTELLLAAFVIVSSILLILPALLWDRLARRQWGSLTLTIVVGLITYWGAQAFKEWETDVGYLFWCVAGVMTLFLCLETGIRGGLPFLKNPRHSPATDSLFLFAWLCAPVLFSAIFVPFNAVRHLITGLPPMVFLAFRAFEHQPQPRVWAMRPVLIVLLGVQGTLTLVANMADYEYANVYRQFANYVAEKYEKPDREIWYVGHWGWMFYAERNGMRQLSRWGQFPQPGDILVVTEIAAPDRAFRDFPEYPETHGELLETHDMLGSIPMRVMNFRKASFYAVVLRWGPNIPYRFFQDIPLETFKIYRITKPLSEDELQIQIESKAESGY